MQTEFRAIVQSEYGAPEKVLKIAKRQLKSEELLATNHPELFEVAHKYEFGDFQKAIQHVSRPGKTGIILLKSPVQEG